MADQPTRVVDAHVHLWDPASRTGTPTSPWPLPRGHR